MARLFISHSSRDNVYAVAFQSWLAANGWDAGDIFIDLHDIGAGERWRDTLRKANAACEAVVLLASPESLNSLECQKEIELAEALGKEIITAIVRDLSLDDPRLVRFSERQLVDLSAFPRDHVEALSWQGQDHRIGFNPLALAKIKGRLSALGISPGSFPWPPRDRPNAEPYPGLSAFDEDDAGIFFGRDADIMAALTEIRLVRRRRAPRLIVIDAASGAGKSSFLRAGLWPRLKRDPDFAPLAVLRPSQGLITGPDGIGRRIAPFFERHRQPRAAGAIYAPLMSEDEGRAAQAFATLISEAVGLATQVRRASNPEAPPPAPLIAIDQAEEMFAAEHSAESERFLALLAAFLWSPPVGPDGGLDPYVLITIRADSVQRLLDRVAALGLETPKPLYLPPLSPAAYREVILKPAEVYSARVRRLEIEPLLADALVRDATGADALPLLAFTLARLFGDFAAGGRLTHEGYVAMGGIAGSIRRALGEAQANARAAGTVAHLRRLLVPALVTWDPEADGGKGAAKRLPADEKTLLAGSRSELAPLAQALVDVRLMRRDRDTLEVAHEALLRVPPIAEWLEEDREFLIWRDRTAKARAAYEANARGLLVGRELDIARAWLEARNDAAEISEAERGFIEASAAADDRRRSEEAQRERAFQAAQLEAARAREQSAELELLRAKEREAEAAAREAAAQERAIAARRVARRTLAGLVAASVLAMVASAAGWVAYEQREEAKQNAAKARQNAEMAERHAAMADAERRQAVTHQKQAEAQSQKARGAERVVQILSSQIRNDVARSREDRDRDIYTRLEREAEKGNITAMRYVGLLTSNGQGVPKDYAKAREWYEKAAATHDAAAMRYIGWLYVNGRGVAQDDAKARDWLDKAVAAGDAVAMGDIGWLYERGRAVPQDYAKAREWYEKGVAAGDVVSMADIGRLYAEGRGVARDYARAREWYERAVAGGNASAMTEIGLLFANGRGVQQDFAKAREWYEKAVAAGNANAMTQIGWLYGTGRGVPRDYVKAREWYENAVAAGDAVAMTEIGTLYVNGRGVPRDYAKAREWYEKAVAAGDAFAMNDIGVLHANGWGVPRDYAKAREWYEKAAGAGNGVAMTNIGWFYTNGRGVPQDYAKAREWFEKAVGIGNATGMRGIGLLYANGRGVQQDFAKAQEWYEKAAATGDAVAMTDIGLLYANGRGVQQDLAKAREWYEKAVAAGDANALTQIGWLYGNGRGVPRDYAKAREWYEKAVAAGDAFAMNEIGLLYANGRGVQQDFAKAREWYEKAVAAGNANAMAQIGWLYANGRGVPRDYAKARESYENAVAAGDAVAMTEIGLLYANGRGVQQDFAKAREWYEKAAAAGNANAMAQIGWLYANGRGVQQDLAKAREWFEQAAAAGDAVAMTEIGLLYANGRGVPRDYAKAREWYEKAAAAGDTVAMTDIGALYYSGLGVPQDFATAREWFEKAAAAGHSLAMSNLGRIYADGQGVPRDYAKAREWYEKAAAAGDWNALGQLSWHALFAREYQHALDATERALKAAPELLWIATNRAHALMFLGKAAEAREVYLTYKGKLIAQNDNKTWQQVIAEDFDELRKAGLNHPQMAEIEAALGIARP